jgi:DNA-binding GntR family transcriptional regulator
MPVSVDAIHDIIRNDIITLGLMPGVKVSENELARRFNTSRTPVREALLRLVDEGLVEVWPQRGTVITPISLRAVRRARFVREAIEVAVFRKASLDGVSAEVLAQLDAVIIQQHEAREDSIRFTQADDAFHRAFANAIAVGDIWTVLEREKAQFDRLRFLSLPNVTPVAVLIAQHERMIATVRARDPDAAEAAVRDHLSEVLKVTEQLSARYPDLIINDI